MLLEILLYVFLVPCVSALMLLLWTVTLLDDDNNITRVEPFRLRVVILITIAPADITQRLVCWLSMLGKPHALSFETVLQELREDYTRAWNGTYV